MPVRPLPPALAEKARRELNEDPARLEEDLRHLKDWINKQPHLNARTDDQWIVGFLRGTKYSLEKAKEKIDLYYSFRSIAPELFSLRHTDQKFKELVYSGTSVILPKSKNETDPQIVLLRPGVAEPLKYSIPDMMAYDYINQKIVLMENDAATVNGIMLLIDMENLSLNHITQLTPTLMKKMVVSGQDASPFRFKGAHYINVPSFFGKIFNLFKVLLSEKNAKRVRCFLYVHDKNYEELYKYIPKEILPAEYGGSGGTLAEIIDHKWKQIEAYSDWLAEDEKYGTDESKRPGKPKTAEEMFGVEGSFRKLEFD